MGHWRKSGNAVVVDRPLPAYEGRYISADQLLGEIRSAGADGCFREGRPRLTLVDYRAELFTGSNRPVVAIRTGGPTVRCSLDEFGDPEVRRKIPKDSPVVIVCETGDRDAFAMRYLYGFGYTNVSALRYGMRDWIKRGYPVVEME